MPFTARLQTLLDSRHSQLRSYIDDWICKEEVAFSHFVNQHQYQGHKDVMTNLAPMRKSGLQEETIPVEPPCRPPPLMLAKESPRRVSDLELTLCQPSFLTDESRKEFPEHAESENRDNSKEITARADSNPNRVTFLPGASRHEDSKWSRTLGKAEESQEFAPRPSKSPSGANKREMKMSLTETDEHYASSGLRRYAVKHEQSLKVISEKIGNTSRKIIGGKYFETFFAVVITVNSLQIGVQLEYMASIRKSTGGDEDEPAGFFIVQSLFSLLFLIELLLRWAAAGRAFFYSGWSYMDMAVVVCSIIEFFLHVFVKGNQGMNTLGGVRIMRLLRITRLARIVRVIRIVRFVYALRALVKSILSTLRSLFWAMLLLMMIIYLCGMLFAQLSDEHLKGKDKSDDIEKLELYWGSLSKSLFTLFKCVTGGVSWEEATYSLSDVHWGCVALFLCYFIFTYFAVLNVVTAVFCQSAIDSAAHDYDLVVQAHLQDKEAYTQKLKALFRDLDGDDSGEVDIREFEAHLRDGKVQAYLQSLELSTNDIWRLFRLLDENDSQVIDLNEFLTGCFKLRGPAKAIEVAEMMYEMRHTRKKLFSFIRSVTIALTSLLEHNGLDITDMNRFESFRATSLGSASSNGLSGMNNTATPLLTRDSHALRERLAADAEATKMSAASLEIQNNTSKRESIGERKKASAGSTGAQSPGNLGDNVTNVGSGMGTGTSTSTSWQLVQSGSDSASANRLTVGVAGGSSRSVGAIGLTSGDDGGISRSVTPIGLARADVVGSSSREMSIGSTKDGQAGNAGGISPKETISELI